MNPRVQTAEFRISAVDSTLYYGSCQKCHGALLGHELLVEIPTLDTAPLKNLSSLVRHSAH